MTNTEHAAAAKKPMMLKPSARLQRYLGSELIADPNLAIIEFVKNGYDAGARRVRIMFRLSSEPTSVTIADDGIGMDEASFRYNWLRPGFSHKAPEYHGGAPKIHAAAMAKKRAESRRPAGEKGLGRLAAGRLGECMEVWTRLSSKAPWLYVKFDWEAFDDMYRSMDEIEIPFEHRDEAPEDAFETGTLVVISALSQSWLGRLPGRPSPGRPRTRLGRLKQDLSFLIRASADKDEAFEITLDADAVTERSDLGAITRDSSHFDTAHYVYRFEYDAKPAEEGRVTPVVKRSLRRSAEVVASTGKPRKQSLGTVDLPSIPAEQWPGPFSGFFTYTPPPAARRAKEMDLAPTGVLLYRDDVLVEPYGLPGNDWLGVEAHKAARQGHAAIQPSTFSGEIAIGREANPKLLDMSNRLGLLDNDASTSLIREVRSEVAVLEDLLYQEVLVEGHWKGKEQQKAAERAAHAEQVAHVRVKALVHQAAQPLQAMAFDVLGLQAIAANQSIPPEVRHQIKQHSDSLESGLTRIGRVVQQLSAPPSADEEFDISSLAEDAAKEVESLAETKDVQLVVEGAQEQSVFAPKTLVYLVLVELMTNAVEVPRKQDTTGLVSVSVRSHDGYVEVRVRDDGTGFGDQAGSLADLSKLRSTKGRPAGGLLTAKNAATASRGDLFISETSEDGTTAILRLPTGQEPVPMRDEE